MSVSAVTERADEGPATRRVDTELFAWIVVAIVAIACFVLRREWTWLVQYPDAWTVPVDAWVNAFMDWFVDEFRVVFQLLSRVLGWPLKWLQSTLHWLPWPATIAAFAILAHRAGGWPLALFTIGALLYMVVIGYWDESMNTLALVGVSVPLAVGIGFLAGAAAYRWPGVNRLVQPTLDLMQTVPTFAYLIPILLLFGFGPVVGMIASAIYACPPMVRNVILGLQRVPVDVVESARMSGANDRQLFWWVKVPSALPTIMVGVNQTTMAGLSMVIIAAIIGGFADIGWEVLSTMRKAQFGQSLLAGLVIALIAMVMDRISRGFTDRSRLLHATGRSVWQRHLHLWLAGLAVAAFTMASHAIPVLREYPQSWVFYPAATLNDAVHYITVNFPHVTDAIKRATLFYFLLPLRIGLESTIRPFTWGFELTPAIIAGFWAAVTGLAAAAARIWTWRAAVGVVLLGGTLYFGITATPWPVFISIVTLLAWQVGGWQTGLFALLGLTFMLVTGFWPQTMLSVYLCAAAVLLSFAAGTSIGVWAAHSDRVSAFVRPINDTLQTMPLFVFLIPILMFFQVGEFTALLAICAYAVVPAVRYTEHGLRNVRPDIVEAAKGMGCTPAQTLWQVKLPLALPEIMLGLNQTIMFGLAMLVIAALVGTKGLGQQVYIALGKADTGMGVVAGLGIALVAMIADRIIQGWCSQRKTALGIG